MLVLSRQRGEVITIGDGDTAGTFEVTKLDGKSLFPHPGDIRELREVRHPDGEFLCTDVSLKGVKGYVQVRESIADIAVRMRTAGDTLVTITVVDIRGDKVRLGVTAPRHIPVHRREVYDAIAKERRQAAAEETKPEGPISWPWQLMPDGEVKCLGCGIILPNDNRKYELKLHGKDCRVGSTPDPERANHITENPT